MKCPKCQSEKISNTAGGSRSLSIHKCDDCGHEGFCWGCEDHAKISKEARCYRCNTLIVSAFAYSSDDGFIFCNEKCASHIEILASPIEIMEEMLETFKERHKLYGDNYKRIGKVLESLFPAGITLKTVSEHNQYHLFMMMVVKLTRFANTNLTHKDSVHDIGIYAAMEESIL